MGPAQLGVRMSWDALVCLHPVGEVFSCLSVTLSVRWGTANPLQSSAFTTCITFVSCTHMHKPA